MFFTGLNELMQEGQSLNLNLMKKGGRIHVCVLPKAANMPEAAAAKLIPLSLRGTPLELDEGFLPAIGEPVRERFGLISNADAFRENTQSAGAKKSPNPAQGTGTASGSKQSKNEKRLAEAEVHEQAGRWPEAYSIYKKLSETEPGNQKMKEKVREVWDKMAQRPLFDLDAKEGSPAEAMPDTEEEEDTGEEMAGEENEEEKYDETGDDALTDNDSPAPLTENKTVPEENTPPEDMFARLTGMANSI